MLIATSRWHCAAASRCGFLLLVPHHRSAAAAAADMMRWFIYQSIICV
jgi:hypothetical protein